MYNIGTSMRALGRDDQAYEWWWKAIQSRPTYWDAIVSVYFDFVVYNVSCGKRRTTYWASMLPQLPQELSQPHLSWISAILFSSTSWIPEDHLSALYLQMTYIGSSACCSLPDVSKLLASTQQLPSRRILSGPSRLCFNLSHPIRTMPDYETLSSQHTSLRTSFSQNPVVCPLAT